MIIYEIDVCYYLKKKTFHAAGNIEFLFTMAQTDKS